MVRATWAESTGSGRPVGCDLRRARAPVSSLGGLRRLAGDLTVGVADHETLILAYDVAHGAAVQVGDGMLRAARLEGQDQVRALPRDEVRRRRLLHGLEAALVRSL